MPATVFNLCNLLSKQSYSLVSAKSKVYRFTFTVIPTDRDGDSGNMVMAKEVLQNFSTKLFIYIYIYNVHIRDSSIIIITVHLLLCA